MKLNLLERRLDRLEAAASRRRPASVMWLEARGEGGEWLSGGRWVGPSGDVYQDADLRNLARRYRLILVCQHQGHDAEVQSG